MKVLNVTIHVGANWGSVLQTYATRVLYEKEGCEVQTLNYIPPRVTLRNKFCSCSSIRDYCVFFVLLPYRIIQRYFVFGHFLRRFCNMTKPYYSLDEIKADIPKADIYMTGSDQVWNSTHNRGIDEVYYYNYLPSGAKRIAFASSIGNGTLSDEECEKVQEYWRKYSFISVRENSAQTLMKNLGFENVEHILDPTLLIDKEEWQSVASKRLVKQKYVFVYIPYNIVSKEDIVLSVRKLAKRHGLKVVTFSKGYVAEKWADKSLRFATPTDFLSLFFHADYVITNSFHGTAFSVNLNKQFWVFEPSQFTTRINSLLELTMLQQRKLSNVITEDNMDSVIDYSVVNAILSKERVNARNFILKSIE